MSKLDIICQTINKEWKEDIASKGIKRIQTSKIPLSSPRLNYMLYGGLPRGRIIEFAGEENGGKTTTALDVCKNAQILFNKEYEEELLNSDATRKKYLETRGPQKVVYADCENTLDEDWAIKIGVDVDDMYIIKPQTQAAEDIFQMILDMIETDEVGLVIIDSLGVMLSQQAYEKDMTEKTYGGISMALTLFSKKAELSCAKHNCTVIGINQMRDDMNSMYGGKTTTGGKAWKHNCFSGNTKLLTDKGIKRFRDFKDGEALTVVDKDGNLREAIMHHFGQGKLQKVLLKTPSMSQEVICTPDHRWLLEDGSITTNLKVGDKLYVRPENVNHPIVNKRQAFMFCLGMIIGDGTDCKPAYMGDVTAAKIVLCDRKENYAEYFRMAGFYETTEGGRICFVKRGYSKQNFLNGECWKYLTPEDNRYLFMGYYAADGYYKGNECCTFDPRVLDMIKYTSGMCGYYITRINEGVTGEDSYKPGKTCWYVYFTTHQNKCNKWVVHSISKAYDGGTYCVEEPITHTFTLEKGIVTGNCSLRLMFAKGDFIDKDGNKLNRSCEEPKGNKVLVSIVKTKVDKPDRKVGFYTLMYDYGIDEISDLVDVAIKYDIIHKAGAWFSIVDIDTGEIMTDENGETLKFQGQSSLVNFIKENKVIYEEIKSKVYDCIK